VKLNNTDGWLGRAAISRRTWALLLLNVKRDRNAQSTFPEVLPDGALGKMEAAR
jgi:hypothetical protein